MPDFKPYIVIGLALGGVYAMSGVGLVVLYRTTGVLNLFYGAIGRAVLARRHGADQRPRLEQVARRIAVVICSRGVLTLRSTAGCSALRSPTATRSSKRVRRSGSR